MSKRGSLSAIFIGRKKSSFRVKKKDVNKNVNPPKSNKTETQVENIWKFFYGDNYIDGWYGEEFNKLLKLYKELKSAERKQIQKNIKQYKRTLVTNEINSESILAAIKNNFRIKI